MECHWEYFSGTYFYSVLMGVQFHTTGNILMVLITIHLLGEFRGLRCDLVRLQLTELLG